MTLTPQYFKKYLQSIYNCKFDYELRITSKTPKTRAGFYRYDKRLIVLHYIGTYDIDSLHHVAIHELAHHIHATEFNKNELEQRPHGKEFYTIYNALAVFAAEKGLYKINRYDKIELNELLLRKK